MHGEGTYVWRNLGQCYVGQWNEGIRHGKGRHHFSSTLPGESCGEFYDGPWKEGVMHGTGRYVDAGGGEHGGVWVDGVCPEVDFRHLPESGNFRYCFSVRYPWRALRARKCLNLTLLLETLWKKASRAPVFRSAVTSTVRRLRVVVRTMVGVRKGLASTIPHGITRYCGDFRNFHVTSRCTLS